MTLIDTIKVEDIYKHWRKNLMAELSLPFSPQSHQYCIYLLDQCNPEDRKELMEKIWNRFYEVISKSGKKIIKKEAREVIL